MAPVHPIRLVVSDVDGTLLNPDHKLAPETIQAAQALRKAGIHLALASARAPGAMVPVVAQLGLEGPQAAFNGGIIFTPNGTLGGKVDRSLTMPPQLVGLIVNALESEPVETWLQDDHTWYVREPNTPLVQAERASSGLVPTAANLADHVQGINRLVAMGNDPESVAKVEGWLQKEFGGAASIRRSMPCRINITALGANKGEAMKALAALYHVRPDEVAVIGDAHNDIPMLKSAGLSIAMGQAEGDVKAAATHVAGDNRGAGWADAIKRWVLPRAPGQVEKTEGA
ncbi:Cof-type HAD-IIB family hydrolase [Formicincola oecophyllae]|uniref:Cof-type HAD-IIB family hydrolase n=1 Tax=Formicincola oecophyllae TaxID=2558361 RepID=UPI00143E077F|nr:Cof-type HAD-IIB family hydrolase [Formicincola oecophyllae]